MSQDPIVASTPAGDVTLVPAVASILPPALALAGIQALHRRALGDATGNAGVDALAPEVAFALVSTAVTSVLGQLAVLDPDAATTVLEQVCAYADSKGMDGLNSVFLAALLCAQRGAAGAVAFTRAVDVWNRHGVSRELCGGALTEPLLDLRANRLTLFGASDLAEALSTPGQTPLSMSVGLSQLGAPTVTDAQHSPALTSALGVFGSVLSAAATASGALLPVGQLVASQQTGEGPIGSLASTFDGEFSADKGLPNRTNLVFQGKALIVDVQRTAGDGQGAASAEGIHFSLVPELNHPEVLNPTDLVWRAKLLPTLVLEGPGARSEWSVQGNAVQFQSLPSLDRAGKLQVAGLLGSIAPPQPAGHPPSDGTVTLLNPSSLDPHVLDVVISLTHLYLDPLTGGDPDAHPHSPSDLATRIIIQETDRLQMAGSTSVGELVARWTSDQE